MKLNNDTEEVEKLCLKKINILLPPEIIRIIKNYLTIKCTIFLNKINYINNHFIIRNIVPKTMIENYIRDTLKRDNHFVFQFILKENYEKWMKYKHYIYKNIIYKNYIYFIKDYCIENESHKCRNLMNDFLLEHGLCQNQHKNNINKNKRWKI